MSKRLVGASLVFLAFAPRSPAQVLEPYSPPEEEAATNSEREHEPPMRLADRIPIERPLVLRAAEEGAPDQLSALEAWNKEGRWPTQIGFSRPLPERIEATFGGAPGATEAHALRAVSTSGSTVWATKVTVLGARGVRFHLTEIDLPPGVQFYTYGANSGPVAFGLELASPAGDLWTPMAFGETAFLEVVVPVTLETRGFSIDELAEIVGAVSSSPAGVQAPTCLVDATCVPVSEFPVIRETQKAVAHLEFMSGGKAYVCTGTLLNNSRSDGTPYLLTANHCLSTQTQVSSLQAFWDYYDAACGTLPDPTKIPVTNGGTLLMARTSSDFSFIRLSGVPAGRKFMGWDSRPASIASGVVLYRVSHPAPPGTGLPALPQSFSESVVDPFFAPCPGYNRPSFIYSFTAATAGAVYEGSSGSAAILAAGYVVGQLTGACPVAEDACTQPYHATDGAFSETYPFIAQWLNPAGGGPTPTPTRTPTPTPPLASTPTPTRTPTRGPTSAPRPTAGPGERLQPVLRERDQRNGIEVPFRPAPTPTSPPR